MIKEIKDGELLIARYIPADAHKNGLNFFSRDEEFVQVGSWFKYPSGKYLNKHFHNELERINTITQEVFFVVKGKVKTAMYNKNLEFVEELILHKGDILIFFNGGHDFTILEDDTTVYEVKNGPYLGANKDKTKF